ncbi:hypothetical protein [Actinomadura rugatobispora]|uniref:Uncharacterized protein n=1 Tax=Actinomadura rugatobispora TaxID=1994 RepID=A0ABW0ZNG9_9ACTN|nr:hypothetical protein GCM10010200_036460 [Actinomadura rugatobispora]
MAQLNVQAVTRAGTGLNPTYVTASGGGDTVRTGPRTFLHVKNGHSSPQTVTIVTPGTYNGLAVDDLEIAVPNAGERMIGPIDDTFRASTGLASITYSGTTSLTIAAIRI